MDKIKDKIKKLLALGQSPNEAEAMAAIEKAHELMLRYGVVDIDLTAPSKWFEQVMTHNTVVTQQVGRNLVWRKRVLHSVAIWNFCVSGFTSYHLYLSGAEPYRTVAELMYRYLVEVCEKLASEYGRTMRAELKAKQHPNYDIERKVRLSKRQFLNGISLKLENRISKLIESPKPEDTVSGSNTFTTQIVWEGDSYKRVVEQVVEHLYRTLDFKQVKTRTSKINVTDAILSGWEAGDGVSLDKQVHGEKDSRNYLPAGR